ncbi:MAG TPA: LCP family protein [Acidimicrobiales bacterium]|nr:LCP family protein [Acidimicrobiales bacterium]
MAGAGSADPAAAERPDPADQPAEAEPAGSEPAWAEAEGTESAELAAAERPKPAEAQPAEAEPAEAEPAGPRPAGHSEGEAQGESAEIGVEDQSAAMADEDLVGPAGGSDEPTPLSPAVLADLGIRPTRRQQRGKAKKKKKSRRSWPERTLLAAVIVVILALIGMGAGYGYIKYRFDQVTKVAVRHLKVTAVGQPFNVLVIGSDSRAGDTPAEQQSLGVTTGGQRSDVVKIVHVDPATGGIRVLSIPRDTVVTVAGDTSQIGQYNRINSTYDSGPDQLVQTIEANFGIAINHVVQVNFTGFRGAVDAIGGINLNFPVPAKDDYTGLNITTPGCQHLNGGYSLAVARSRHYQYYQNGYWQTDGTSDFGRIQRQNAFLKALITQAESRYNPLTINAFIGSVVQGVTIDNTFDTAGLIDLAREFHSFSSASLATATLPTYSQTSDTFAGLGDVLFVQQPDTQQTITQFLGQAPETATTPPPDPYGAPTTVPTTVPATGTTAPGQTTTPASSTTTTTVPNFDPIPC